MRAMAGLTGGLAAFLVLLGGEPVAKVPDGYEIVAGSLEFSRDGKRVAYVAQKNGKFHAIVGAEPGEAYDEVAPPVVHPSGSPLYFRVMERDKQASERWTLLRDGKKVAEGGWVGPIGLGERGEAAYWVFKDRLTRGSCVFSFGKKKTKQWQTGDLDSRPGISADGKLAVTVATRDEDWVILSLSDKGEERTHGLGSFLSAVPTPDGKGIVGTQLLWEGTEPRAGAPRRYHLARMGLGDRADMTKVNDKYLSCGSPCVSADSQHIAFKVLGEDGKMGVAVDDRGDAACTYVFVDELTFAPDGGAVAYAACLEGTLSFPPTFELDSTAGSEVLVGVTASRGKWSMVAGEKQSAEYEWVHSPTWSPKGHALAFVALQDGKSRLVVGERTSEPCDEIGTIAWDPSGKRVWYGCREGRELSWRELALE